jgi:hypothetical protein
MVWTGVIVVIILLLVYYLYGLRGLLVIACGAFIWYVTRRNVDMTIDDFTEHYVVPEKRQIFRERATDIFKDSSPSLDANELPRLGFLLANCGTLDALTLDLRSLGRSFQRDLQGGL